MATLGGYELSTERGQLDIELISRFLAEDSYWAKGIPRSVVEKAIRHSMCFAAYHDSRQVAFARVVTDYATYAHVMDVFVVPEHRGRGLGKLLMSKVMEHPDLQGLRLWTLGTMDAHGLYERFGFAPTVHVERWMERRDPDVYARPRP